MTSAFVEFNLKQPENLTAMNRFVLRLKEVKEGGEFPEDSAWEHYFSGASLSYFESLSSEEMKEWEAEWKATPVERRLRDLSLWPHWDFGSFLDALKNGDFQIISLNVTDSRGKLKFDPIAYPYGGADSLVAVVEAFGQEVLGIEDGSGYKPYVKQPRWLPKSRRTVN